MNKASMANRNSSIDNARALGILLVVLGHVWIVPPPLQKWIYSFHMPAFFLLSGYLFDPTKLQTTKLSSSLISRARRLMVPHYFYGCIGCILSILTNQTTRSRPLIERCAGVLYSVPKAEWTFNCTPIWFLSCLFCVYALYSILSLHTRRSRHLWVTLFLCVGFLTDKYCSFFWPWNLHIAFSGTWLFHCGTLLREVKYFEKRPLPVIALVGLLLGSCLLVAINPTQIAMAANRLGNPLLFVLSAFCGSLFLFECAKRFSHSAFLSLFGKNTLPILCLNYWMYAFVFKLLTILHMPYWWSVFLVECLFFLPLIVVIQSSPILRFLANGEKWVPQDQDGYREILLPAAVRPPKYLKAKESFHRPTAEAQAER